MASAKKLVIVESPNKVKSISGYLGDDYLVMASVGHIREIATGKSLPDDLKKIPSLKEFGVHIEKDFEPYFIISEGKKRTVSELKSALKDVDEVLLATDEDREGEAIAWHLQQVLKPKVPVRRMVFNEITKDAINEAVHNTRELNQNLVDAQVARQTFDRLLGFELSSVARQRVRGAKSAGRVQSPAVRLIVDRERERMAYIVASYASLTGTFTAGTPFEAKLTRVNGTEVAEGDNFNASGQLKKDGFVVLDLAAADALGNALTINGVKSVVKGVESKPYTRRPAAPFTTSTMQQEASRKFRWNVSTTMQIAQSLYENGHITYMRTDSTALSQQAVNAARTQASERFGAHSLSEKPRVYASKSKNAQEAHEAIRPAGEKFETPAQLSGKLSDSEHKLYDLIYKRTLASQMKDATGSTAIITIEVGPTGDSELALAANAVAEFRASGTVITDPGFKAAYEEGSDKEASEKEEDGESQLPNVTPGQEIFLSEVESNEHSTKPPARYTEASLIKKLEELGIGRPSTYASILSTIVDRGYVSKQGQALVPSWIAFVLVQLLEQSFSDLVSYDLTAEMEDELDEIANGEGSRLDWLNKAYFGDGAKHPGVEHALEKTADLNLIELNRVDVAGVQLDVWPEGAKFETGQVGANGKARRITVPREIAPADLTAEKIQELVDAPVIDDRVLGEHPETGLNIVVKTGQYGPYVLEELPDIVDPKTGEVLPPKRGKGAPKPRTASLFSDMDPATVDLETAVRLLGLPRVIGTDPATGEPITSQNGPYGAYIKRGTESRSLPDEASIFSIDLDAALALLAEPKKYGANRAASSLKEFGADPVSGKPIKAKNGKFGVYLTDGVTNATVPRGEDVATMDFDRACELIAIKRGKGSAAPRATKSAAKKPAAKKTPAKKTTTKKTVTMKPAAKKAAE